MAWHKRFQPEKSFLEDELETVGMGGSDVVLGSAVTRIFTYQVSHYSSFRLLICTCYL